MPILSYLPSLLLPVSLYISRPFLPTRARYYLNLTLYLSSLSCVATYAAFAAIFLNIIGRPYDINHLTARTFYAVASRVLDLHLEVVEGSEILTDGENGVGRPVVVMHNHQSMLDILILGFLTPKRSIIISKSSLKYSPLGPFMLLSRSIFLNRSDPVSSIASLKRSAQIVRDKGLALWMFPEGTRTNTKEIALRSFKKGGFHLAIESGIPIVPVVTENYWKIYHKGVFETGGAIRVKVLEPISTEGLTSEDAGRLADIVREKMLVALHELAGDDSYLPPEKEKEKTPVPPTPPPAPVEPEAEEEPETPPPPPSSSASTSSLVNISSSIIGGNGNETEEEEGMVIVGRPS